MPPLVPMVMVSLPLLALPLTSPDIKGVELVAESPDAMSAATLALTIITRWVWLFFLNLRKEFLAVSNMLPLISIIFILR